MATAPVAAPADQYQTLKTALCEVFGLDPACSDEDFQAAFAQFKEQAAAAAGGEEEFAAPPPPVAKAKVAPVAAAPVEPDADDVAAEEARKAEEAKREGYEEAKREFAAQLEEANRKSEDLNKRVGTFERQRFEAEVDTVLTGAVKDEKMLPSEVPAQRELLLQADRSKKITFADKSQKTQFAAMVEAIKARPSMKNFKELSEAVPQGGEGDGTGKPAKKLDIEGSRKRFANADKPVSERSLKVDARTKEIMDEKKIGYGQAQRLADKEFPKE